MKTTKIKFVTELNALLQDDAIYDDEKLISFSIFECMKCHWRFVGEANRFGYGYASEGVQTPNYCPMCGTKISDELAD